MGKCICSICLRAVEEESAPILSMSGAGVPRYLCEECEADIAVVTEGSDPEGIRESIKSIMKNISDKNIDDPVTVRTVSELLENGAKRALSIEDGSFDPDGADEITEDEAFDEIPEELLETEEDRALDEAEEEKYKKIDKVLSWMWAGVLVGLVALMAWWLFF